MNHQPGHPTLLQNLCLCCLLAAWLQGFGGAGGALAAAAEGNDNAAKSDGQAGRPTLFLIGDSTVNNGTRGQMGWGTPLPAQFDTNRLAIVNRARGGRSSRTFLTEGLWAQVAAELRPGDFVLMQFGHNDGGPLTDGRARASLKGTGEQSQVVTNQASGKVETVHTYGWYLRQYVTEARAKGARPIVVSPVPRNMWKEGKVLRASNDYGKWAAEVARAEGVPFLELNELVAQRYEAAGAEQVQARYFGPTDHTHTTAAGAELNAACVAAGVRAMQDCALRRFLRPAP